MSARGRERRHEGLGARERGSGWRASSRGVSGGGVANGAQVGTGVRGRTTRARDEGGGERGIGEADLVRRARRERGHERAVRRREPPPLPTARPGLNLPDTVHSLNGLRIWATTTAMTAATRPMLSPSVSVVL